MRFKWHRLLTNPRTHVESVDGDVTLLRVEGLVCDAVCARRTRAALRSLDGIERVEVDFDAGMATITGRRYAPEAYERAVTDAVAGKPLRRAIERTAGLLRITPPHDQPAKSPETI